MEKWLSLIVGVFLIGMILYGHHRGFIRLAVSAVSLIVTLIVVQAAMPQVTGFLKNNTGIYEAFENSMQEAFGFDENADQQEPSVQRVIIEGMQLPKQLKDALLENNNNEVYRVLGVDTFTKYVARYLANSVINIIGFLVLFVVVFAVLRIVTVWLDLVAKLPILSGMNKIAGAVLGGAEAIFFLWILCFFVTIFAGTEGGRAVIQQIEGSVWLSFIYDNNPLSRFVMTVVKNIL